ncbi:unnamed protein product [Closterium sp. NIES-64]|nr:unnamed protein product [Closterium sp. NIES-64]
MMRLYTSSGALQAPSSQGRCKPPRPRGRSAGRTGMTDRGERGDTGGNSERGKWVVEWLWVAMVLAQSDSIMPLKTSPGALHAPSSQGKGRSGGGDRGERGERCDRHGGDEGPTESEGDEGPTESEGDEDWMSCGLRGTAKKGRRREGRALWGSIHEAVRQHFGRVHVRQHFGRVHVRQHFGRVHVGQHFGRVHVGQHFGRVHVGQHFGRVHVGQHFGRVHVGQHFGRVHVGQHFGRVHVGQHFGRVHVGE